MADQFQHIVQKAFLERWKVKDCIYLIDKSAGTVTRKQSAKNIIGMENMQTPAMEKAFADVESCIGNTDHDGEITKDSSIRLLAKWMALHLVRNALNADSLRNRDYSSEVVRLATHLAGHHAWWMDVNEDVFITGDNPIVQIKAANDTFYIAALSPRRCLFVVWEDT